MLQLPGHPSRTTGALVAILFTFVFASLATRDASAHERPRNLDVGFEELKVRVDHGQLRIAYEIERQDWRRLEREHIRPRLNVYAPHRHGRSFDFVTSVPVTSREAVITLSRDATPRRANEIELRLSGERGRTKIATTSYRSACGSRVRVAVRRVERHDRDHDFARRDEGAIIKACSANTSWSGDLSKCMTKARGIDRDAPAAINACGASTSWSGDFLSCLDLAANLNGGRDDTIRACSAATSWSGDFQACMKSASAYRVSAAPTIRACSAATSWSGDFKACLDDARHLGPRAPRVVDACGAATSWSGEFKQCLVAARRS